MFDVYVFLHFAAIYPPTDPGLLQPNQIAYMAEINANTMSSKFFPPAALHCLVH
jgi:hypothetical protein